MAVTVGVDGQTVAVAPPIARKFVGQPLKNLIDWMNRQGGLRIKEVDEPRE